MVYHKPRTAIIGAGVSGLAAGKTLASHGIPYDCFEASDRVGGNWAFGNPNGHSSAYRSLHINSSKDNASFRSFPVPKFFPDYPHHTHIKDYLEQFAATFGLNQRIQFENGVVHADRHAGGGWTIDTQDGRSRDYDVLIVANGHHWDPRFPDFPGHFDGESIHSHQYIDPTTPLDLVNKRILVVGIGNSAADIVSELSQRSNRNTVFLSTRSGAWIVPKYLFGIPTDRFGRTAPGIPLRWQRFLARKLPTLLAGSPENYGLPRPDHHFLEAHPTMSTELLLRLGSGDAAAKPNVARLDGDVIHFEDGTSETIDVIVYATGYNISFPFFGNEFISAPDNRISLYKRMLKPGIDDLVFIGFAQAIPSVFPFVESQCELLGAYLTGTYRPPAFDEMERVIKADEALHIGHYSDRPRHTQQVDFFTYARNMSKVEIPAGARRVEEFGPIDLSRRAHA